MVKRPLIHNDLVILRRFFSPHHATVPLVEPI